jgi:predicted RNase H-like HicB family nuclease
MFGISATGQEACPTLSAYVPDLSGCAAVAETEEEVRRLIREAIQLRVRAMIEDGDPALLLAGQWGETA